MNAHKQQMTKGQPLFTQHFTRKLYSDFGRSSTMQGGIRT